MKEIGIYIHIPFCIKKCEYCDFVSYCNKEKYVPQYINALKKEIKNQKCYFIRYRRSNRTLDKNSSSKNN